MFEKFRLRTVRWGPRWAVIEVDKDGHNVDPLAGNLHCGTLASCRRYIVDLEIDAERRDEAMTEAERRPYEPLTAPLTITKALILALQNMNVVKRGIAVRKKAYCDICSAHGEEAIPADVDARTKQGGWANLCWYHAEFHGIGIGAGYGQVLLKKEEGKA